VTADELARVGGDAYTAWVKYIASLPMTPREKEIAEAILANIRKSNEA